MTENLRFYPEGLSCFFVFAPQAFSFSIQCLLRFSGKFHLSIVRSFLL